MSVLVPFPPLRQETLRAIVVVGDHGETAVALRDALPRAMVVVLDARPAEAAATMAVCRPCPWALVWSSVASMPAPLGWARLPTIVVAAGTSPAPPAVERCTSFGTLLARLQAMLAADVGGMRLARGVGVELPDGSLSRSAWLQAMVSRYPAGVGAMTGQLRAMRALLRTRVGGWTAARGPDGTMALVREVAA